MSLILFRIGFGAILYTIHQDYMGTMTNTIQSFPRLKPSSRNPSFRKPEPQNPRLEPRIFQELMSNKTQGGYLRVP